MPPSTVHFNGSVNLPDAETVIREIAGRVPDGVRRIPDGEPGDRQNWIFFQLQKFWQTPGLEQAPPQSFTEGYEEMPKVRLADGQDPDAVTWPNLGYADAYLESYRTFSRLREEGVVTAGTLFQVQYPTPLASISSWVVEEDQDRLLPSYTRALFADLDRLLAELPHAEVAVQWDVAVEFGILEGQFAGNHPRSFDEVVDRLVECVDHVPADVPVGLHLCYGDYQHRHFKEPESLELQVRVANALTERASRPIRWFAFTVPQYQREVAYFAPIADLRASEETELYFALVPYHPEDQTPGTTEEQIRLIDEQLGGREWGVCTECGIARCQRDEVAGLLDLHHEIVAGSRVTA
ncbi:MAG TPA: hypothetical protein VLA76_07185 [Candidatus Angelobacter sp.]|nr:hypothetical protein [Candidatus Angelobacter sp.]